MTREIPLTRGMVAWVDDVDYEAVAAEGKWHANPEGRTFYAYHTYWRDGKNINVPMHRFVTGWPYVDHANSNGLDNRRENLRQATHAQNMRNSRKRSDNTSGYKGVSRSGPKWQAVIQVAGRQLYLGTFVTPLEAALAYDAAAVQHSGKFARPNFPLDTGPLLSADGPFFKH